MGQCDEPNHSDFRRNMKLETFEKEHISHFVKFANQKKLYSFLLSKKKTSVAEQQQAQHENLYTLTHEGAFAGFVEFIDIDFYNKNCKFYISTEEPFMYGKALDRVVCYCFDDIGLYKITTFTLPTEQKIIDCLGEHGFKSEVRWRQHHFRDASYCGIFEFSLLLEDIDAD